MILVPIVSWSVLDPPPATDRSMPSFAHQFLNFHFDFQFFDINSLSRCTSKRRLRTSTGRIRYRDATWWLFVKCSEFSWYYQYGTTWKKNWLTCATRATIGGLSLLLSLCSSNNILNSMSRHRRRDCGLRLLVCIILIADI
jgi:hypothetical protein